MTKDHSIRVGVVGAGSFGKHHIRLYGGLEGAELVGITDLSAERGEAVAKEFGTRYFPTTEALAKEVQAVSVVVPTLYHREVASFFLERGVDVFVEKPLASTVEEARAAIDLATAKGRLLQVGHIERFNPIVQEILPVIRKPIFIEVHRLAPFPERSLDVDVVLDLMIHDLDLVLLWVGEMPVEVRAVGVPVLSRTGDIANARLEFPGGCVANLTASRVSMAPTRKFRIFEENAYISLDLHQYKAERYVRGPLPEEPGVWPSIDHASIQPPPGNPLRAELAAFVECVRTRSKPFVSGEDGLRALEVGHMILSEIAKKQAARQSQASRLCHQTVDNNRRDAGVTGEAHD